MASKMHKESLEQNSQRPWKSRFWQTTHFVLPPNGQGRTAEGKPLPLELKCRVVVLISISYKTTFSNETFCIYEKRLISGFCQFRSPGRILPPEDLLISNTAPSCCCCCCPRSAPASDKPEVPIISLKDARFPCNIWRLEPS